MEQRPSRFFRAVVVFFLFSIVLELGIIASALSGRSHPRGNIAVVDLKGEIQESRETVQKLEEFSENEAVKAIVLRIDSPGGAVGGSQEIHDAVKRLKSKKPIVASMGDLAASGGYYAAAPASRIVANPGTLTGSIGVIAHFFMIGDLLKKAYLHWEVIKSGGVKDIGSPLRPLTAEERKLLQAMTDDIHNQFIEAVSEGRKIPIEKVRSLADGRVMSGRQAKAAGLVDELGGLDHAITVAAKLGGVTEKPDVIYPEEENFSWLRRMAEGKFETSGLKIEYRLAP